MQDCAIVIAPHWEKGGSNNIFAAQIAHYKNKGWAVVLILVPEFKFRTDTLGDFRSDLNADYASTLKLNSAMTQLRYRISKKILKNDAHDILHRNFMIRNGTLNVPTLHYLRQKRLREICVNWCDNVDFALKIRTLIGNRNVPIVVHTHDVFAYHNKATTRDSTREKVRDAEIRWLNNADRIVHVSDDDAAYFETVVSKPCVTSYITLYPEVERRLTRFNHTPRPRTVLYVGSWNVANPPSVEWFINQVLPFTEPDIQFYFAGSICEYMKKTFGQYLYSRPNVHLLGRVDDVSELYENSQAVMLPTKIGTGASVKFVEALAMGVPMLMTSLAVRGLPHEVKEMMAPFIADRPVEFARKISAILDGQTQEIKFREIYWRHFSNKVWSQRLDAAS